MKVLNKEIEVNGRKIRVDQAIVERLVRMAAKGNLKAMGMVIDRVDGKVPETFEVPTPFVRQEKVKYTPEEQADFEKYFKRNDHGQHQ